MIKLKILFLFISFFSFQFLSSQVLTETLERFENGQSKVIRHKTSTLKNIKIEFLNKQSKVISKILFDTITNKLDGDFFDPFNKGDFIKGKINCRECSFSFDENLTLWEGSIFEGKINGNIKIYDVISLPYFPEKLINTNLYNEVPNYIITNINRFYIETYSSIKLDKRLTSILSFKNGIIDGIQKLNYNITSDFRRNVDFKITNSELEIVNGILKGFKTIDTKGFVVDSIYESNKTWRFNNELIENKGDIFYLFDLNQKFNINDYNSLVENILLKNKMEVNNMYEPGTKELLYYFPPLNLNSNKDGVLIVEESTYNNILNSLISDKIIDFLETPEDMFESDFSFSINSEDFDFGSGQSLDEKMYIEGKSYIKQISDKYQVDELKSPMDFFNFITELIDDNMIYINSFIFRVDNTNLSQKFKEIPIIKEMDLNKEIHQLFIRDLEPYFNLLDKEYKSFNENKNIRSKVIKKIINDLLSIKINLETTDGNGQINKIGSLEYERKKFIKDYFDKENLIEIEYKNKSLYDENKFDKIYFLNEDDFNNWTNSILNLISISQEWMLDLKEWDLIDKSFTDLFYNIFTKYPVTNEVRDAVIEKYTDPSYENRIPENSILLKYFPSEKSLGETFKYDDYNNQYTSRQFVLKNIDHIKINSLFNFKNYFNNYKKIKSYLKENTPKNHRLLKKTISDIEVSYKRGYINDLKITNKIPINLEIYSTSCDNSYVNNKLKSIYSKLSLNFERIIIYKSINSDWGFDGNVLKKFPKKISEFDNPKFFSQVFYKSQNKFKKDIEKLNEENIDYIIPIINQFESRGGCDKNDKNYTYTIIIIHKMDFTF